MEESRNKRFLIVEDDDKYASWLQHAVASGWSADTIVLMDWTSFGRVRTAMTVRDYDIVMLAMKFDEGIEEPTTDSFDWIRKLRSQPGFPEMIILAEDGSELSAFGLSTALTPEILALDPLNDFAQTASGLKVTSDYRVAGGPDGATVWSRTGNNWSRARASAGAWSVDKGPIADPNASGPHHGAGALSDGEFQALQRGLMAKYEL